MTKYEDIKLPQAQIDNEKNYLDLSGQRSGLSTIRVPIFNLDNNRI